VTGSSLEERRERTVIWAVAWAGLDRSIEGWRGIDLTAAGRHEPVPKPLLLGGMAASTWTRSGVAPGVVGHTLSIC
jgi:hypothetical protein